MPWTVSSDDPTLVTLVLSGTVVGVDLREATLAAVEAGRERHVMRFLVDATAVVRYPGELDVFVLPAKMYDDLGLDRHEVRVAVVAPAAEAPQEMVRFYETACVNRGWQVRTFDAPEPAIAWLGVESRAV